MIVTVGRGRSDSSFTVRHHQIGLSYSIIRHVATHFFFIKVDILKAKKDLTARGQGTQIVRQALPTKHQKIIKSQQKAATKTQARHQRKQQSIE